jgi:hypothetical protein
MKWRGCQLARVSSKFSPASLAAEVAAAAFLFQFFFKNTLSGKN